jgi:hypothetical protein
MKLPPVDDVISSMATLFFLGALRVLAVKNLITARFAQDAKSAKKAKNLRLGA